ncbi:cytochrome c biogenesis protein CcsA [Cohnella lubricantis]|uniref:Cytochrome c biogenesis protein CcsA n=1 Tax=Cohnella lubricantis TaxID=2163172 RepID=A0A841TC48_9BACL|nr:cytochrome c biogenesis protein CcsA [Cohnella lubricantis]MBB6677595.1 cytochrome c biogenesis protein CcsA [Cohnella lubricantis]MBP2116518.1 HemX protein [Cohnella lubricantis]
MLTNDWLSDAVLYIYALSLLFFVSDAAYGKRNGKRIGTGLLVFVWILQTGFLLDLLLTRFFIPQVTLQDYIFFIAWVFVSFSLVLNLFVRAELLVLLVNVVGFAILSVTLMERPKQHLPLAPGEAAHRLLIAHIALITVAFVLLTVAGLLCAMLLFLNDRLKRKKWGSIMSRMPSLTSIDRYAYFSAVIGAPLLLLSLSTGTAALIIEGNYADLADEKVLLAFASAAVYLFFLLRRMANKGDIPQLSRWHLAAYILLVIDFFANWFSSFHRWV